jgi:arginine-tRNA-protein transferase
MADEAEIEAGSGECPYFADGRAMGIEAVRLGAEAGYAEFHEYMERGFRRYADLLYRPACPACAECTPVRLDVTAHSPSRSERRTLRQNADVLLEVVSGVSPGQEHLALFAAYQGSRHGEPPDARKMAEGLLCLHYGYPGAITMEYRLHGRLVGVGVVDEGRDSLSSNYFYYDVTLMHRRLGVFSVLMEIDLARRLRKRHLYLGYAIKGNPKLAYKAAFRPSEALGPDGWTLLSGSFD